MVRKMVSNLVEPVRHPVPLPVPDGRGGVPGGRGGGHARRPHGRHLSGVGHLRAVAHGDVPGARTWFIIVSEGFKNNFSRKLVANRVRAS